MWLNQNIGPLNLGDMKEIGTNSVRQVLLLSRLRWHFIGWAVQTRKWHLLIFFAAVVSIITFSGAVVSKRVLAQLHRHIRRKQVCENQTSRHTGVNELLKTAGSSSTSSPEPNVFRRRFPGPPSGSSGSAACSPGNLPALCHEPSQPCSWEYRPDGVNNNTKSFTSLISTVRATSLSPLRMSQASSVAVSNICPRLWWVQKNHRLVPILGWVRCH